MTPTHLGSINEKSTRTLQMQLRDGAGVPVNPGSVTGITFWLRDLRSNTVMVSALPVYPSGGGAISLAGVFTFPLTVAHTTAIGTAKVQKRVITLDIVFTDGRLTHEVSFDLLNLTDIA